VRCLDNVPGVFRIYLQHENEKLVRCLDRFKNLKKLLLKLLLRHQNQQLLELLLLHMRNQDTHQQKLLIQQQFVFQKNMRKLKLLISNG
jgi:hypothetical protein